MAPKPADSKPRRTPGTHTGGGKDYRSALPGPGSPLRLQHPG